MAKIHRVQEALTSKETELAALKQLHADKLSEAELVSKGLQDKIADLTTQNAKMDDEIKHAFRQQAEDANKIKFLTHEVNGELLAASACRQSALQVAFLACQFS